MGIWGWRFIPCELTPRAAGQPKPPPRAPHVDDLDDEVFMEAWPAEVPERVCVA